MFRKLRILSKLCTPDENATVLIAAGGEENSRKVVDLLVETNKETETHLKVDGNISPITGQNHFHKPIDCADLVLLMVRVK